MEKILSTLFLLLCIPQLNAQGRIEIEQQVIIGEDTLYGSLLSQYPLDKRIFKKQPLAIIIPGSGPTDRDGNSSLSPGTNDTYKQLADSLLKNGISTFRYDKPGIGKSKLKSTEAGLRFEDNIRTVQAIVDKMDDIGFRKIVLIGHSEGALSGMMVAQEADVEAYISLAGMGRNMKDLLVKQLSSQLSDSLMTEVQSDLDSIQNGHTVKDYHPMLFGLLRPSVQPYLESAFQLNPTTEIAKLDLPVLIVQGEEDLQVTAEDARALHAAAPKSELKLYPKMNHVLKQIDGSAKQNHAAYMDPDFPIPSDFIRDLSAFIHEHTD